MKDRKAAQVSHHVDENIQQLVVTGSKAQSKHRVVRFFGSGACDVPRNSALDKMVCRFSLAHLWWHDVLVLDGQHLPELQGRAPAESIRV